MISAFHFWIGLSARFVKRDRLSWVCGLALALGLTTGEAASTWNQTGGGNWDANGNWTPSGKPDAVQAVVIFTNSITADATISRNSDSAFTVGSLTISPNNGFNYTLANTFTITFDNNGTSAFNVSGNGAHIVNAGMVIAQSDDLVLTQDSTGTLTITGTINSTSAGASKEFTVAGSGNTFISGLITDSSGTINLIKSGTGTLTLTADNSYAGTTLISAGVLRVENGSAFGAGANTLNGGTLEIGNVALANNLTLTSGTVRGEGTASSVGTMTIGNGSSITFSTVNSGDTLTLGNANNDLTGGNSSSLLTFAGPGTVIIGNSQNYSGGLDLTGGTLQINSDLALGSTANDLTVNGGTLATIADINLASGRVVTIGGSGATLDVSTATTLTVDDAGQLGGSGQINKVGLGTLSVTASQSATYTGNWNISGGALEISADASLGNSANDVVVSDGATLAAIASLNLSSGRTITIGALGGTLKAGTGATLTIDDAGQLIGSTDWSKDGPGTLTISADQSSTLTGNLNIADGTLSLGAANVLNDSASVTVTSGATFNMGANAEAIGSLAGAGTITRTTGNLTAGGNNQTTTFSGTMDGSGSFTKEGSGALTLSGANTYSGGTLLNGGSVVMADYRALGIGALTLNNGSELQVNFADGSNASRLSGITVNDGTIRRIISSAIPSVLLTNSGTAALTVNGSAQVIDQGNTAGGYLGFDGPVTVNNGGTLTLNASGANSEIRIDGIQDTTIAAGGTLATTGTGTKRFGSSNAQNIAGQGTSAAEATFAVGDNTVYQLATTAEANGSGTGGLRVEGTQANVSSFLTASRVQTLTGSGGTLTIVYSNENVTNTFSKAPIAANNPLKLGFDVLGTTNTVYSLGAVANDLANWNGLVVKGGRVEMAFNQSLTGGVAATTLTLEGGRLSLAGGTPPGGKTLTIEGDATLSGGILDGGPGGGSRGKLVVGGNIFSDGTVLENNPDITMNPLTGTTTVSGSTPLNGIGTFTKTGGGTVQLDQSISANTVTINQGTLLLGASDRINDTASLSLSGGTFNTGGFDETLGLLTLTANSSIDFGSGTTSTLHFDDSSFLTWSGTLTITNYHDDFEGLFFGSAASALTGTQLSQIVWEDPFGSGSGVYVGGFIGPNGRVRPVPVPEASTVLTLVLLAAGVLIRERGTILAWRRRVRAVADRSD